MRKRIALGVCRNVVEAGFEKLLREEGYRVFKPEFPMFLTINPNGEPVFIEGVRFGARLSRTKKRSMELLAGLGFKVELLCQVRKESQMRYSITPGPGHTISLPQKRLLQNGFERGRIFDPDKHFLTQTEKDEMTEIEKKREREYQELQEIVGGGKEAVTSDEKREGV